MNREARAHREQLLDIHHAHLRELELQAAKYGDLNVPSYITLQIADYRHKIAELEEQMSTLLPHHNLPPRDYERFVGRQNELAEVQRLLGSRSRAFVITIDGIGGIGKSALALEAAYTFYDTYARLSEIERFEAIVWVSAKRSYLTADGILERRQAFRALDDLYAAIAQVLDFPAITRARAEKQRAIVEQVLGDQRTLLILDNLETVDDEDLMVFLRELPAPTKAIVTTRHRIDVAHPVRLAGMPHEDALALIDQEAARKEVTLTAEDREQLWLRTGGVPLAIVWSIGLMGLGGSVESVLRRLGSGQSDIAQFCFSESVAQIRGRDAYRLLLALSIFAVDASRDALGVVAGLGEDAFGRDVGLEELLRLSLVNKSGDRFSLLPLTRSFVQSEATAKAEWMARARERWQNYFFEFADKYGGWTQDWQNHDRIERDLSNTIAALNLLLEELYLKDVRRETQPLTPELEMLGQRITKFIPQVSRVCRLRGYWSDCDRLSQIGVQICLMLNDQGELGWRYHDLSRISYFRGDLDLAKKWASEARAAWRPGSPQRVCYAERILGLVALAQGDLEEAERLLNGARSTYGDERMDYMASNFIEAVGMLTEAKGDRDEAIALYRQAVDVCKQTDNVPGLAANLLSLGAAQFSAGDFGEARQQCQESLRVARECSRADVIARALYWLAVIDNRQKQYQAAESSARQALDLFRRLGMRREQVEAEALLRRLGEQP